MEIFVVCPGKLISGGPELAHQFCESLNRQGCSARMCYVDIDKSVGSECIMEECGQDAYKEYNTTNCSSLEEIDNYSNIVVIPEALTALVSMFKQAKNVIWWMSVDNYFAATNGSDMEDLEHVPVHLVQSYYAKQFCNKHFVRSKILAVSDYISPQHGSFLFPAEFRRDVVLYNPKKGIDILNAIKEKITSVQWIPLAGLSREEMIVLMQSSKIYVDFGNHPGKDRIPREAAANGCCVITNRKGSAAFYEDVPIKESYKFSNPVEEVAKIDNLINDVCLNFPRHQDDFIEYREWIKGEKERFDKEVSTFIYELMKIEY